MISKKDVEKLIEIKTINSIKNHWSYSNLNNFKINGEIRQKEILIWKNTFFLRTAYPIFIVYFDDNENYEKFEIIDNPFYLLLRKLIFLLISLLIVIVFFYYDYRTAIFGSIGIIFISIASFMIMHKSISFERSMIIKNFKYELLKINAKRTSNINIKIKEEKIIRAREWTLSKILSRILIYPFGIFIFYSTFLLIKEGKVVHGIAGILIVLLFFITDLLIIFKMENNKYVKRILNYFE